MTFLEILQDSYRRLGFTASPASDVITRFKAFANETHRSILSDPDLTRLRDGNTTFASVADREEYGLTPAAIRISSITERTNQRRLVEMSLDELRALDPALTASGDPEAYIRLGLTAVALQPSAACELFLKSTAAGDTQVAYVEGFTTGGFPRADSVTLTGVTAVSLDASITTWARVTKVYLASNAAGVVTLHEASGSGTELARIGIGQKSSRYQGLQLYPTPSQAITYYVDGQFAITDMVNDTDVPLLPDDFHDLIGLGIRVHEYEKTDDLKRLQIARQEYNSRRHALRYWVISSSDSARASYGRGLGFSTLGGWYPRGT
jgi:hypothetical protein